MKRRIHIPGITNVAPKSDGSLTLVQVSAPAEKERKPGIIGDGSMRSPYRYDPSAPLQIDEEAVRRMQAEDRQREMMRGEIARPDGDVSWTDADFQMAGGVLYDRDGVVHTFTSHPDGSVTGRISAEGDLGPAGQQVPREEGTRLTPTLLQRGLDALRGRSQISGILDETNFMPTPEEAANDQPPDVYRPEGPYTSNPATFEEQDVPLNGQIALALGWQSVWPCTRGSGRWFMESPNPSVAGENMVQVVPDYIELLRQYLARDGARLVNELTPQPRVGVLPPMQQEEAVWADRQGYLEIGQTHATVTRRYGFRQYVREVGERYRVIPPPPAPTTTRI